MTVTAKMNTYNQTRSSGKEDCFPLKTTQCTHDSVEDYKRFMLKYTQRQMSLFMDMDLVTDVDDEDDPRTRVSRNNSSRASESSASGKSSSGSSTTASLARQAHAQTSASTAVGDSTHHATTTEGMKIRDPNPS